MCDGELVKLLLREGRVHNVTALLSMEEIKSTTALAL